MKELVVEKFTAHEARLDRLEMVDHATKEIYCTWIENGDWKKIKGECANVPDISVPASQSFGVPTAPNANAPAPAVDPKPISTSTISAPTVDPEPSSALNTTTPQQATPTPTPDEPEPEPISQVSDPISDPTLATPSSSAAPANPSPDPTVVGS